MRKTAIIILILTFLCSGCINREIKLNVKEISHDKTSKSETQFNDKDMTLNTDTEMQIKSDVEGKLQNKATQNKTLTSISPNGEYCAEAYGTINTITAGGLFPYEGIRIIDKNSSNILYKMEPGY